MIKDASCNANLWAMKNKYLSKQIHIRERKSLPFSGPCSMETGILVPEAWGKGRGGPEGSGCSPPLTASFAGPAVYAPGVQTPPPPEGRPAGDWQASASLFPAATATGSPAATAPATAAFSSGEGDRPLEGDVDRKWYT